MEVAIDEMRRAELDREVDARNDEDDDGSGHKWDLGLRLRVHDLAASPSALWLRCAARFEGFTQCGSFVAHRSNGEIGTLNFPLRV